MPHGGAMERGFEKIGEVVATRPVALIAAMIFLSFLFSAPAAGAVMQTNGLYLWVPTYCASYINMIKTIDIFGGLPRNEVVLVTSKNGGNVLTFDAVDEMITLHHDFMSAKSRASDDFCMPMPPPKSGLPEPSDKDACLFSDEYPVGFGDICSGYEVSGNLTCSVFNPLSVFNYDHAALASIYTSGTAIGDAQLLGAFSALSDAMPLNAVFENVEYDASGILTKAEAMLMPYQLDGDKLDDAMNWEAGFLNYCWNIAPDKFSHIKITCLAQRSLDDEVIFRGQGAAV